MKYEITIRQLEEFTEDEKKEVRVRNDNRSYDPMSIRYSDQLFHERRVLNAEVSKEEFEVVKKAIIGVL